MAKLMLPSIWADEARHAVLVINRHHPKKAPEGTACEDCASLLIELQQTAYNEGYTDGAKAFKAEAPSKAKKNRQEEARLINRISRRL